ncbi:serine/threonine-protein kinase [Aureliella helgolandensis]|uniref:non-specific serine/threonine protein kinase n=1 Tax=Aureliella helgolandensis TaxID=2527968 RepID=A0A518G3P1_9BACT|nr:serine/threonine-protein kinase [Aureliella helgolandensis]QDV23216.1 Serine/threonine-protein kinase PrkC [Aureliella helgolandensis]
MKTVSQCLQESDIEALLTGNDATSQSQRWEEHISSCDSCRVAMASRVGDLQWWHEAERSLQGEVTAEGSDLCVDATDDRESTDELLELLGPTDDPLMLGRIGTYEVLGVLGRGGMGIVFKAFDAPLNRYVAIKMLLPHLAASGAARKRFQREGQAAAAVIDDHVLPIYAVSQWQNIPYLVMQYSSGKNLQRRIDDEGPLEVKEILRIGMQAARGLAAAHAQGLVHRDVKPSNMLLDGSVERVMLTDFGLARAVDDASITRTGIIAGTPQYMSPEQASAETVDHRSDLFSLGSVLYAMCVGHSPFRAESSYGVLRLITDREPRPIRELNPEIPEWLCLIIGKLMAKQPVERFDSAEQVAELLEGCLAHVQEPTTTSLPASAAKLVESFGTGSRAANMTGSLVGSRFPPIGKLIVAAAFAFFTIAATIIFLESGKGTIRIETNCDTDVPIVIRQGDEVVKHLTISRDGATARLKAGQYILEIEGDGIHFAIEGNEVTLSRSGTWLATISETPDAVLENAEITPQLSPDKLPGGTELSLERSPEFASVKVKVLRENRTALAGTQVKIRMIGSSDRPVEVKGVSNKDGVAIDQALPYGKYQIEVTTPASWQLSSRYLPQIVQFGKGLDLTIVAPSSDENCVTVIDSKSKASADSISSLRFGEARDYMTKRNLISGAYGNPFVPEPDAPPGEFHSFPTPTNGVGELIYSIRFHLTREVLQVDGTTSLEWTWQPNGQKLPARFMVSRRGLHEHSALRSVTVEPTNHDGLFMKSGNDLMRVGYYLFQLGEPLTVPHKINHPPGNLTVYLADIYGRPNADSQSALGIAETESMNCFLPISLQKNSQWLARLLNIEDWSPYRKDQTHLGHLLRKDVGLKPSDEATVQIDAFFGESESTPTGKISDVLFRPFSDTDVATEKNSGAFSAPQFAGQPVSKWLDDYWEYMNTDVAPHQTGFEHERALKSIVRFRSIPACDDVITAAMTEWFAEIEHELDAKTLTVAAHCIATVSGKRHQKSAVDYLFNMVDQISELTLTEELIEDFYDEGNPWNLICKQLPLRDEAFVKQIADRLRNGSTNQRLLALQLSIGTESGMEETAPDSAADEGWIRSNRELLLPALLIASHDDSDRVRLHSLLMLQSWSTVDGKVSIRMKEAFESDPSLDVQSFLIDCFYPLNKNLDAIHDKLMTWAKSRDPETVLKAMFCMMQPSNEGRREHSIDSLILLLSDPEWGLEIESRVPANGTLKSRKMRQFAITLLGEYGKEARRGLPVLQAELARDRELTRTFAQTAIVTIASDSNEASMESTGLGL